MLLGAIMNIRRLCHPVAIALLSGNLAVALAAQTPTEIPTRIALEDEPNGAAAQAIADASLSFPVAARVEIREPLTAAFLNERLAEFERRRTPLWVAIPAASSQSDIERWRNALRGLLERRSSALMTIEIVVDREPSAVAVFSAQVAATEARSRRQGVQIALGGPAMNDRVRREEIYSTDLAPYVDLITVAEGEAAEVAPWLTRLDPSARIALRSGTGPQGQEQARRIVDNVLDDLGSNVGLRAWRVDDAPAMALRALAPLAALMTHPVSTLDETGVALKLSTATRDVTTTVRHRLLFDTRTFSTYLAYWGEPAAEPLDVSLTMPVEGVPGLHDLLTGTRSAVGRYTRNSETRTVQLSVPLTGRPMLVDFNEGAVDSLTDTAEVVAARKLTVAEIISRHRQAQLTQDVMVRNYSAIARMRQFFRPTVTDSGYDVVTENRYYVEGSDVEWEELSFSVNGSKWDSDRPPFPLLQPEKVLSIPLQLRFDEGYDYRLDGTENVDGFDCYVVRFEPIRRDSALYRGTIWIDQTTFARIRVKAVQGGLPAPVVSNEETHRYVLAGTIGNQPVFLLGGLTAQQIVLIAGRNLLVEKNVTFDRFVLNHPDFDSERTAARASDRIMFRETDAGLRYYVKEGQSRVVSQKQTSEAKALAMGVYLDPSYSFPLPIIGLNYLNFSLAGNQNTQFALLFGGVLAAGNIQRPKLGSTVLDASLDFFAIAVPSSDRLYTQDGEVESERVLTWPMSTGLNLGWQATPFQKATFQYQLRFDAYVRDTTTSETFEPPSSTLTNGIGGSWEYRRGGYNVTLNGTWYARGQWDEWGEVQPDGGRTSTARTYAKYTAGVSRNVFLGPFQKLYVNAAWFGGKDLDRFVQYQFGMFDDTRIHGVPASGVRFGELAMVRGSYSLNVFEIYRLDLFLEQAWGRERSSVPDWQPILGTGVAINFRTPWNTILRADFGKSFLPELYRGVGSSTLQVLLLKPLG